MSICIHSGQNFEVSLLRGRVLGFESGSTVLLACVEGSVWVTAPGGDDVVLLADESTTVKTTGRVVVQALKTARVLVTENRQLPRPSSTALA